MRKLLLGALVALGMIAPAHAGFLQLLGVGVPTVAAPAGYTGPGDVVASATFWYGLRAYSSATRGNAAINVCNVSDVACADMSTNATTGDLTVTTIGGSDCSVIVCTVKKIYDQTAGNNCGAASCDLTTTTSIATRPTLVVNCVGGKACLAFNGAASQFIKTANNLTSVSQPFTTSDVGQRTGVLTTTNLVGYFGGTPVEIYYSTTPVRGMYAGTGQTATATDSAYHVVQSVFNGASSVLDVDGTGTTTNPGAGATGAGAPLALGSTINGNTQWLTGNIAELGLWPSAFSGGNRTSMCHNQFAYWGTSTSC